MNNLCRLQLNRLLILYRHQRFCTKWSQIGVHGLKLGHIGAIFQGASCLVQKTQKTNSTHIKPNQQMFECPYQKNMFEEHVWCELIKNNIVWYILIQHLIKHITLHTIDVQLDNIIYNYQKTTLQHAVYVYATRMRLVEPAPNNLQNHASVLRPKNSISARQLLH